jgi:tetratricopeptide (TPR) repeat protein
LAIAESAKQAQEGERLMKCYSKKLLLAFFSTTLMFYAVATNVKIAQAAQATQTGSAQASEKEEGISEEDAGITEEEFNEWEAADKGTDPLKSGALLIDFIKKYPNTKLMKQVEYSYKKFLIQCHEAEKYQELETLAEQWNAIKPGNVETITVIALAAGKLGHNEKYVQRLEELYKIDPKRDTAYDIAKLYKERLKNESKYIQWTETIMKYPESDMDFGLRYELMQYYTEKKDMGKALEFAQATIKAADLVVDPSEDLKKTLRSLRHQVNHVIGVTYYEQKKYADAIKYFQHAIKAEKYAEGYYWIGMCQWAQDQQDQIDEAILSFAKAEIQGGNYAPKAKEKLEFLYKKIHNGMTIGIDKVYRKAKETPDNF